MSKCKGVYLAVLRLRERRADHADRLGLRRGPLFGFVDSEQAAAVT